MDKFFNGHALEIDFELLLKIIFYKNMMGWGDEPYFKGFFTKKYNVAYAEDQCSYIKYINYKYDIDSQYDNYLDIILEILNDYDILINKEELRLWWSKYRK